MWLGGRKRCQQNGTIESRYGVNGDKGSKNKCAKIIGAKGGKGETEKGRRG